ncbi:hypothetical protein [Natrinema sp. CBA1119]|uniref:hypothetical protein n=1 Tax=Natrinema sp. CBA1119 TaxID=1608465 RepID=UPI001145301F|nr:hypothetical protein [Natrinema sp. CBA1119]
MAEQHFPNTRFRLISVLQEPNVPPNGTVDIDLYFSGVGTPFPNKFQVILPDQSILDDENVGVVKSGYGYRETDQEDTVELVGINEAEEKIDANISYVGFTSTLPEWFFANVSPDFGESPEQSEMVYPMNVSETKISKNLGNKDTDEGRNNGDFEALGPAPMHISLNLDSASPGNHQVEMTFVYRDGATFWMEEESVKFHVSSWPERHRLLIATATILSGFAVFGIILQLISMI